MLNLSSAVLRQIMASVALGTMLVPNSGAWATNTEYVIVTTSQLAPHFEELKQWKRKAGLWAEIMTLDSIIVNYLSPAEDTPKAIRDFISDYYQNHGLKYALIGGGLNQVPTRYAWHYATQQTYIADSYYGYLDGSWDADGDAVFGEPLVDDVDFDCEVAVGRLPATSASEVDLMVGKLFDYERAPTQPDFLGRALLAGSLVWMKGDGFSICQAVAQDLPSSLTLSEMYQWIGMVSGVETRDTLLAELDRGQALFVNVGQSTGPHNFLARYKDPQIYHDTVTMSDILALTNLHKSGIVLNLTCNNAKISQDCIALSFMRAAGGSCAYIGSTSLDTPDKTALIGQQFITSLYQHNHRRLGDAL